MQIKQETQPDLNVNVCIIQSYKQQTNEPTSPVPFRCTLMYKTKCAR